jgi:Lar family restriction alleviation protein
MTDAVELLPCPFCGGAAEMHAAEYGDGMRAVCSGCGLELEAQSTAQVTRLWNTRTPPAASEDVVAKVAWAIDSLRVGIEFATGEDLARAAIAAMEKGE